MGPTLRAILTATIIATQPPVATSQEPRDIDLVHEAAQAYRPVTDDSVESILSTTVPALDAFNRSLSGLATVPYFANLVGLTHYYFTRWEHAAENLTDEQRHLAVKLADRLYGGAFGGYLNDFDPLTPALQTRTSSIRPRKLPSVRLM